jgi:hypothetical protein
MDCFLRNASAAPITANLGCTVTQQSTGYYYVRILNTSSGVVFFNVTVSMANGRSRTWKWNLQAGNSYTFYVESMPTNVSAEEVSAQSQW